MRQFSHSVQKLKSAEQDSSEWTREASALGRPHSFFGKGMGDLPDTLSLLRPAALTGVLAFPFQPAPAPQQRR
jgi:hypothetical protein